ncbi:6-phosphogluconolactonase [Qipengyuania sp. DGS5-3]|uniref:6-phosphogluconolactonase n=1 Tax=Qipengyuania sp. DGS5-3 TaxID=3349632 RepID=UPI0036D2EA80
MSKLTLTTGGDFDIEGIADFVEAVIERSGFKSIAVPGGSTPFPIFDALASRNLDWAGTTIYLTDDREVPPEHPASNYGRLLAALGKTGATIVRLEEGMEAPDFDLVWLGMGADGHVASLFPNTDPRLEASPCVLQFTPDPLPPEAPFDRLSWTLPALLKTKALLLTIKGADKHRVLYDALAGHHDLPITRLLNAAKCPVRIFGSDA